MSVNQVLRLGEYHMLEQQAPNHIQPTDEQTAKRNDYRSNQRKDALSLKECRPSYTDFDYPVNERDQKQQYLYKTALLVKPCSHKLNLRNSLFVYL